jgi:DNA replication protein DnaC
VWFSTLAVYARIDLLVIDDWGLAVLTEDQRRDMLEILEDRHDLRSTVIASQLPIEKWHKTIGDPTLGDKRVLLSPYRRHNYLICSKAPNRTSAG